MMISFGGQQFFHEDLEFSAQMGIPYRRRKTEYLIWATYFFIVYLIYGSMYLHSKPCGKLNDIDWTKINFQVGFRWPVDNGTNDMGNRGIRTFKTVISPNCEHNNCQRKRGNHSAGRRRCMLNSVEQTRTRARLRKGWWSNQMLDYWAPKVAHVSIFQWKPLKVHFQLSAVLRSFHEKMVAITQWPLAIQLICTTVTICLSAFLIASVKQIDLPSVN